MTLPFASHRFGEPFRCLAIPFFEGRSHLRDDEVRALGDVIVIGGDWNVVVLGVLEHGGEGRVRMRREHNGVNAARDQVLNVGDLLIGVLSGVKDDEFLDQLRVLARIVFDLVDHLNAERIGDRVVRDADNEWRFLFRRLTGRNAQGGRSEHAWRRRSRRFSSATF